MKVDSCILDSHTSLGTRNYLKAINKKANLSINKLISPPFELAKKHNFVYLSFTSNAAKNLNQLASIAPEYQGILDKVYKVGGLGNVAGEAAVALQEQGNMDVRTFIPYYSPNNSPDCKTGFIKLKRPIPDKTWDKPKFIPGTNKQQIIDNVPQFEKVPAFEFVSVPVSYNIPENSGQEFVIHEPVVKGKEWNTGYKVLEKTNISGRVQTISEDLSSTQSIPYQVFKIKDTGVDIKGKPTVYVVHTPELSVFPVSYGGDAYAGKFFDDKMYSVFSRASVDAIEKMGEQNYEGFNPGNFWLHDRQAFPAMMEISERSSNGTDYWNGIRAHASYHNPGRNYQGHYISPIDFFRINGNEHDLKELKKVPANYDFVKEMNDKITRIRAKGELFSPEDILTKEELERLNAIFEPLYGQFKDELGEYNLCNIPVAAIQKNPYNFSAGTVSRTYGKEMKNHSTKEIAYGLTSSFASIPTVDIVNGSSAKSLHLDVIGSFGDNNGFTEDVKQGFTPLTSEIMKSKDKLYSAKQANKKWLIDTIAKSSDSEENLQKLFFSQAQIDKKSTVLGSLSKYSEGDVLFISWGRADSQKGFPTTLEGFLQYFKNSNVPAETKEHAKVLIGAGPWDDKASDWKAIQKKIQEIQELDGGRYKNNVCYLNGRFSNRIVACADYTNITSRYEPCGITPLESYAGGTPVISNNTGGSPDFVKALTKGTSVTDQTGFLTKHAYLVNPDVIGADANLSGIELDEARCLALGKENSECIEQAMNLFAKPDEYKKMMMNAACSKIDWHENMQYNQGKSAIELYKEQAWHIDKDNLALADKPRNLNSLKNLKGKVRPEFSDYRIRRGIPDSMFEHYKPTGLFSNLKQSFENMGFNKKCGTVFLGLLGVTALAYIIKRIAVKNK